MPSKERLIILIPNLQVPYDAPKTTYRFDRKVGLHLLLKSARVVV